MVNIKKGKHIIKILELVKIVSYFLKKKLIKNKKRKIQPVIPKNAKPSCSPVRRSWIGKKKDQLKFVKLLEPVGLKKLFKFELKYPKPPPKPS